MQDEELWKALHYTYKMFLWKIPSIHIVLLLFPNSMEKNRYAILVTVPPSHLKMRFWLKSWILYFSTHEKKTLQINFFPHQNIIEKNNYSQSMKLKLNSIGFKTISHCIQRLVCYHVATVYTNKYLINVLLWHSSHIFWVLDKFLHFTNTTLDISLSIMQRAFLESNSVKVFFLFEK